MAGTGTPDRNLSTEHQEEGDAGRPQDMLGGPNQDAHWPKEYDPARDVGKAKPSGNPTDDPGSR